MTKYDENERVLLLINQIQEYIYLYIKIQKVQVK